jgi:hypothetical protein
METNSRTRLSQDNKLKLEKIPLKINMDLYSSSSNTVKAVSKFPGSNSNTIESNKLKSTRKEILSPDHKTISNSANVDFKDMFNKNSTKKENIRFLQTNKVKITETRKTIKSMDFQVIK